MKDYIKVYNDIEQGSEEWHALRRGILTASEIKNIITMAKLQPSSSEKERAYLFELAAQSVSGFTEPQYISDDMLRGHEDEIRAKILYREHYAPITDVGFIVNEKHAFKLGFSPDGLVGDDGLIECKSRRQRFQMEVILSQQIPREHIIQVQAGILISEREWCDYISYCGGMPMVTIRAYKDQEMQDAILMAANVFYDNLTEKITRYNDLMKTNARLIPTERDTEEDIL